ncbi:MAG TPA: type IV pilus secretin PilQ [bacterium]|nr:type IV pilus secretin PilQ [bacterium]
MKSATLTVLLALVLSVAVVASAKPGAGSLTIAKGGVTESFENSIDGTTLFYPGAGQLKLLLPGSVTAPQSALADVQSGLSGSREFSMFALDLEGNSFAVERSGKALTLKIGDIETITSLKEETPLKQASVSLKETDGGIFLSMSEKPLLVRYFTLANPERLVFDLVGIKGKMKKQDGVRYANHPAGFRVVMERSLPAYFTMELRRDEVVFAATDRSQLFADFKVKQQAPTIQKNELAAAEREPNKKHEIDGFVFAGEDPQILKLSSLDKLDVQKKVDADKVEIVVKNTFITKDKEQLIDAGSLAGPVKELAIFNEGSDVKIVATLKKGPFALDLKSEIGGTEVIFAKNKPLVPERVAGFTDAAQSAAMVRNAVVGAEEERETVTAVDVAGGSKVYRGKKISLDFKDVDILDVLRLMSEISKLNIIAGDDVRGTITVRLINIPWDEALDVILKSKSLGKERLGSIIRVAALSTIQREKEAELAKIKADQKLEPVKVRLIAVNYAMAAKLMPQVKDLLSERGSVTTDERTNVLIVKDVEEILDKVEQLVAYLDTQTPQVLIEAKIIEATTQSALGLGVEWGTGYTADARHGNPTGAMFPYNLGIGGSVSVPGPADHSGSMGFSFGSIGNVADLNLTLNVMEAEGRIKIVSSPKVATLDNSEAMIQQGVSVPITTRSQGGEVTTKFIDATLILKTTPHITSDGSILMKLNVNKSEADYSNTNYLGEPAILKKEAQTEILVRSGDTVVIGGVYTNKVSKTVRKVPLLGDIPILGWLFKQVDERVERSELLIFITPRIMNKVKSSMPLLKSEEE